MSSSNAPFLVIFRHCQHHPPCHIILLEHPIAVTRLSRSLNRPLSRHPRKQKPWITLLSDIVIQHWTCWPLGSFAEEWPSDRPDPHVYLRPTSWRMEWDQHRGQSWILWVNLRVWEVSQTLLWSYRKVAIVVLRGLRKGSVFNGLPKSACTEPID